MSSFQIKHITRYTYASPVVDCTNQVMLYPLTDALQEVKKHELVISYYPLVEIFTDYFGNKVGMFTIVNPHTELVITSLAEVATTEVKLPDDTTPASEQWEQLASVREQVPYMDFLQQEHFSAANELADILGRIVNMQKTPYQNALSFSEYVYTNFEYSKGVTSVETKVDEIWELKAGVCQDFAHMLLFILRRFGIPARYVSGYICPKDHELRGEGATHAWVEAFIPDYGWLGFDPTNKCIASDRHIRLAIGRNFSDCTPVKGTYKGSSEHTLEVSVIIENGSGVSTPIQTVSQQVFSYQSSNPTVPKGNSYRFYMEQMQQQQQQ
jgi:transglutaminase-like putative cysteine protease